MINYGTYSLMLIGIAFILFILWFIFGYLDKYKLIKKVIAFIEYLIDSILKL